MIEQYLLMGCAFVVGVVLGWRRHGKAIANTTAHLR